MTLNNSTSPSTSQLHHRSTDQTSSQATLNASQHHYLETFPSNPTFPSSNTINESLTNDPDTEIDADADIFGSIFANSSNRSLFEASDIYCADVCLNGIFLCLFLLSFLHPMYIWTAFQSCYYSLCEVKSLLFENKQQQQQHHEQCFRDHCFHIFDTNLYYQTKYALS